MWRGRVVIIPFAFLDVSSLNDLRTGFVFFKCLKHKTNEINNWRRPVLVHTALLNTGIWAVNVNLSQFSNEAQSYLPASHRKYCNNIRRDSVL